MGSNRSKLTARFLVPSIVGIILFMIPVKYNGDWTITVKIIADIIGGALGSVLPLLCVIIVTISAVMSLISLGKPKFITEHPILKDTFCTSPIWVAVRVLGAIFIWLTYLGVAAGDEDTGIIHMITEGGAGGFVLGDLLTVLVIIFVIAALLLPLPALLCSSQPASIATHSTVSTIAKIFLSLISTLCSYLLPHVKVPADATTDCHGNLVLKIRVPQQGLLLIIADKRRFYQGCRHS